MNKERVQIGYVNISDKETFRTSYEVARWYKDIEAHGGKYPLYASYKTTDLTPLMADGVISDFITYKVEGVVVGSDFTSLYAGNPVGSKIDEEVGNIDDYIGNARNYQVANAIMKETGRYELFPEFHVRKSYSVYNGDLNVSSSIFNKERDIAYQFQQYLDENDYPAIVMYGRKDKDGNVLALGVDLKVKHYFVWKKVSDGIEILGLFKVDRDFYKDEFFEARNMFLGEKFKVRIELFRDAKPAGILYKEVTAMSKDKVWDEVYEVVKACNLDINDWSFEILEVDKMKIS